MGFEELTDRDIGDDLLVVMTLDPEALEEVYGALETVSRDVEDNLTLARRTLQDPSDEADDIATNGRVSGARSELRPRAVRVGVGDVESIQSWVSLFDTDAGAAAYLDDFVQDVAKGIGGGVPSDLEVVAAESFALDPIAAQTTGLVITEARGDSGRRLQTLVGFRVGRLLGFVAVVHPDDDRRLRAIGLGELLAERVRAVLAGELTPPPPPPVLQPLEAYEFEYVQVVDKGGSTASINASGVEVVGRGLDCRLLFDFDGLNADRRYVIEGSSVMVIDQNAPEPAFERTSRDAVNTAADLIYCPGWPVELLASGLDVILAGRPITETSVDFIPAISYVLDAEAAVAIGLVPSGSGISVDRFEVTIDAENPWVRVLSVALSGSSREFADAFGEEFLESAGTTVEVTIDFRSGRINDPTLTIPAP